MLPSEKNPGERGGPRTRPDDIQDYYRDPGVVQRYMTRRTGQPMNGMVHARQVAFVDAVIRQRAPRRLLEVACGPARLTAEITFAGTGVAFDGSAQMLAVARDRLRDRGATWLPLRGDAFALPVADASVDLALSTRFIRRFHLDERRRLYAEIRRTLIPGGALIIDAQNRAVSLPHRQRKGLDSYPVFDQLYDRQELTDELAAAGFRVVQLEGILRHFAIQSRLNRLRRVGLAGVARALIDLVERVPGEQASTWMVLAEVAR